MAMSVAQLHRRFVNKRAMLTVCDWTEHKRGDNVLREASAGIQVPIWIVDARFVWGTYQVLVVPLNGGSSTWVKIEGKVRIVTEWPQTDPSAPPDEQEPVGELDSASDGA